MKNQRVRSIQGTSADQLGTVRYFLDRDPWLAYQLGRNLNFREFRDRDGIFDASVSGLAGPMPDGTTAKITANNQTSCGACHNLPNGNPGGAVTFAKDAGRGRNSPHYYGAGLVEMLAIQIRADILSQVDTDGSGWISADEAAGFGGEVFVHPSASSAPISYGSPALSDGRTGTPALNNIFRVWYVDKDGVHVPEANGVDGRTTAGYNFELVVWGWGQGAGRSALNPTNRAFLWDPFKAHGGLEAYDPSTTNDPDGDGVSEPTLCGAIQFPATHRAPDAGLLLDPAGFSRDDPDGDGHFNEISAGDLDLAEWFMLNVPAPAFAGTDAEFTEGLKLLDRLTCTTCHVSTWNLHAQDKTYAGDRRFFELETSWNPAAARLEGRVEPLTDRVGDSYQRRFGATTVVGLFSDLAHHDMGEGFEEVGYDGTVNRLWRTAPLWGVGTGFPWGHDGASLTLHDVILRHTGDARDSREAYLDADESTRRELITFLEKLQLYDLETLATDLDGDGRISDAFTVAGRDTGPERFNPEWLFENPVLIQGWVPNASGATIRSFAAVNLDEAYGQLLPYRLDTDRDGWPDFWDAAPTVTGYHDGKN